MRLGSGEWLGKFTIIRNTPWDLNINNLILEVDFPLRLGGSVPLSCLALQASRVGEEGLDVPGNPHIRIAHGEPILWLVVDTLVVKILSQWIHGIAIILDQVLFVETNADEGILEGGCLEAELFG